MAWQVVSLDFVTGLPLSGGFDCVLVVVDAFTKYAHFLGLKHPFTAYSVAVLFHNNVYKLHGMPIHLVSNWDHVFLLVSYGVICSSWLMCSGHSERQFQLIDWVFLKLQPYVQLSLVSRATQKLAFKFFGAFKIIGKVGNVAYRLLLPDSTTVHPVFHVARLKKAILLSEEATSDLPSPLVECLFLSRFLQLRSLPSDPRGRQQVLVRWSHMPASWTTWEDVNTMQQHFSQAAVWGQPAC
jgi:hypothetical protein